MMLRSVILAAWMISSSLIMPRLILCYLMLIWWNFENFGLLLLLQTIKNSFVTSISTETYGIGMMLCFQGIFEKGMCTFRKWITGKGICAFRKKCSIFAVQIFAECSQTSIWIHLPCVQLNCQLICFVYDCYHCSIQMLQVDILCREEEKLIVLCPTL